MRGKGGALCSGAFRYPLFGNAVYEGALVSGRRHGAGRQVCHSGVYVGEFKDGEMSGSGRRQYCDGGSYQGEWRAGLKHGHGRLEFPNGDSYEGEFSEGEMHGHGVYSLSNGDVYTGGMHRDAMQGEGEYMFGAPLVGRYKGQFVGNKRHGKGSLEFEDKMVTYSYAGDFRDDAQTGHGVLHMSCGDKYSGEFLDGKYHGCGEYVYRDGSVYKGEFYHGLMHGLVTRLHAHVPAHAHAHARARAHTHKHTHARATFCFFFFFSPSLPFVSSTPRESQIRAISSCLSGPRTANSWFACCY